MKPEQRNCVPPLRLLLFVPAVFLPSLNSAFASDSWCSFRNGGDSVTPTPLPTTWSPEGGIAWQQELIGYGQSAPVIIDNKVFTTSVAGPMCEQLVVQCFDLANGRQLWKHEQASSVGHPSNYMNARAAPTPLVDKQAVYAFFETGDFLCLDHHGELRWQRNEAEAFGKFENNHGLGSSPAIDENHLYLLIEHDGPSSLSAIDKTTGKTVWQTPRKSTKSWASPIVASVNGRKDIVVSSGGTVTGYSAIDGSQTWQLQGIEGNSIPSPVAIDNLLLVGARLPEFASDGQVQANCCLNLARITDGKPHVVWRAEKAICEYASPVACGRYAYFLNKANVLHCIEIESGNVVYRKRQSLDCWATPIVSGQSIFLFGKNGQTRVVRAGPEFFEIANNALWNPDEPPLPESYTEAEGSHGSQGSHGRQGHGEHGGNPNSSGGGSRPGGGMTERMMAGDANKDGVLQEEEVPSMFRAMMSRIDTNGDGQLDTEELHSMAKRFAERRKDASASARDPIVYGVAAADGRIVARTGTRLYVLENQQ